MHDLPKSFPDVVDLWESPGAMASDIGAPVASVRKWKQRESIPAEWWHPILGTEKAREAGVTADLLAALAAKSPLDGRFSEVRA